MIECLELSSEFSLFYKAEWCLCLKVVHEYWNPLPGFLVLLETV